MVGQAGGQPARRLAAIMFTDLVGYSALAHRDEKLAIELLEVHRAWIREILPIHGGIEIETVGDAFLVEFAGALAAVECAAAIQQRFAEHNQSAPEPRRMQLRIGIHLGDVEHKDSKVMGDGVNIASRIHGMATPGGICVSEDVHHAVRNRGFSFESLGAPALKNIDARVELFRLDAVAGGRLASLASKLRRGRRPVAALAGIAVLAAAAVGVWRAGALLPAAPPDKSVAVLPFANLSSEKDSEYFADGIHDTVITHLARVDDLKTISRTSVLQYRDPQRNLREIGRALGVAHVVEGTVQRAGSRVRVTAQLIKVSNDHHLWAESYDRDVADVFGIQSEIARNVASGVKARLTAAEIDAITRQPTDNAEAYDLYLRALKARHTPATNDDGARQGLALVNRAIDKDPDFALAYALAAHFYNALHWWFSEAAAVQLAERAARKSLELEPDLAEGHVALGHFLYWAHLDYAGALEELEQARRLAPGNSDVALWKGYVLRRQGKWPEALVQLEQATLLDPARAEAVFNYGQSLMETRRYAEAERVFDRALALDMWPEFNRLERAYNSFLRGGDLGPMVTALGQASPEGRAESEFLIYDVLLLHRDFEAAARTALGTKREPFWSPGPQVISSPSFAAIAFMLQGNAAQANIHAHEASKLLQAQLDKNPSQYLVRLFLAFAEAGQGRKDSAVAEARRALEDSQPVRDAITHAAFLRFAARFFAYVREDELALDLIDKALRTPFGIHVQEARHDPSFDALRGDARFQKLIEKHLAEVR